MQIQGIAPTLASELQATAEQLGYRIVRVRLIPAKNRPTLQIMAEPMDGGLMGVNDCRHLSRVINPLLDVEDAIESAYNLEVSSPGIERPLVCADDYVRFQGKPIKVKLHMAQNGQKRFSGTITSINDDIIQLQTDQEAVAIPLASVKDAHLVVSDEEIRAKLKTKESA